MKVPAAAIDKYGLKSSSNNRDGDLEAVISVFDEPQGGTVLIAGCNEEPCANILSEAGWSVTGYDLLEYDKRNPRCNYRFTCGDFCQMNAMFWRHYGGTFGAFVSISAIEHFGLGAYGESIFQPHYDKVAMQVAYDMLKPGGTAYVTVPFGARYAVHPLWRVYDVASLHRLIGKFSQVELSFFANGPCRLPERFVPENEVVTLSMEEAASYHNPNVPHVTVMLILKKPGPQAEDSIRIRQAPAGGRQFPSLAGNKESDR